MELKHLLELSISVEELPNLQVLFGSGDKYLRQIRSALDVRISAQDSTIRLSGEAANVTAAAAVIEQLQNQIRRRNHLSDGDVGIERVEYSQVSRALDRRQEAEESGVRVVTERRRVGSA